MSKEEVDMLRKDLNEGLAALGKRLGFLERTVYTLMGGIVVVGFLMSTGHLKVGA